MITPEQLGIHKMLPLHWLFGAAKFIYDHNWKIITPILVIILFLGVYRGVKKQTIIFFNYWDLFISFICWLSLISALRPNIVAGLLDGTTIFNIRFTGPQVIVYFVHSPLFFYSSWLAFKNNKGVFNILLSLFTKHSVLILFMLLIIGSSRGKRNDETDEEYAIYQLQVRASIIAGMLALTRLVVNRNEITQLRIESDARRVNNLVVGKLNKNKSDHLKIKARS